MHNIELTACPRSQCDGGWEIWRLDKHGGVIIGDLEIMKAPRMVREVRCQDFTGVDTGDIQLLLKGKSQVIFDPCRSLSSECPQWTKNLSLHKTKKHEHRGC